jgi:hypothetical protein
MNASALSAGKHGLWLRGTACVVPLNPAWHAVLPTQTGTNITVDRIIVVFGMQSADAVWVRPRMATTRGGADNVTAESGGQVALLPHLPAAGYQEIDLEVGLVEGGSAAGPFGTVRVGVSRAEPPSRVLSCGAPGAMVDLDRRPGTLRIVGSSCDNVLDHFLRDTLVPLHRTLSAVAPSGHAP